MGEVAGAAALLLQAQHVGSAQVLAKEFAPELLAAERSQYGQLVGRVHACASARSFSARQVDDFHE